MSVIGNQNGIKIKDPDARQDAYRDYCQHIADGYPKDAWFYKKNGHSLCYKTMEKYIADHPTEFLPILMEEAEAKRFKKWFDEGWSLIKGKYRGGSPVVWQTIMRNIFRSKGWDVQTQENVVDPAYRDEVGGLMQALSNAQKKV